MCVRCMQVWVLDKLIHFLNLVEISLNELGTDKS